MNPCILEGRREDGREKRRQEKSEERGEDTRAFSMLGELCVPIGILVGGYKYKYK